MQQQRIPIFPLGVVLLPRMPLPLHIFEERYKEMIARCIDESVPFGMVYASGSKLQSSGCTARVERVLEEYDDGRSDILTFGERRFHIERVFEERSYMEAEVSYFDDAAMDGAREHIGALAQTAIERLETLGSLSGHEIERDPLASLDPQSLSFIIGASGVFTHEDRQSFLDMRSTEERLSEEVGRLEQSIAQRQMIRDARRTLGLKGDLSHLLN
ncbi:MAG: ATP-dependent protease La domain-containing protein [Spirochaetes bacterium]|nr:ATP-dependent protease La domain-containing protein [Spirochaetota bacterium]